MARNKVTRRLAAVLAADMVGYSRLMELDEEGTIARQKVHREELIYPKIAEHDGRIVKTTGDGVLAEFASVVDAVRSAVELQQATAEREADVPDDHRIRYRIGLNLGDIVIEDDDVMGDGVNVAARLEALALPGEVLISGTVFDQLKTKLDYGYQYQGERRVKNIAEPVRVYRVVPDAEAGAVLGKPRLPLAGRNVAAIAAVVLVLAAVGIVWWRPWAPDVVPASVDKMAFPLPKKPSIAVLPFANLSGDKAQDYFADGLTEDFVTNLASFPNLFVIARNSTRKFKGKQIDTRDVAHDLGVQFVLKGSVRRADDTLRITAQLVDALRGAVIWAQSYDRNTKEVFALQDEITRAVVSKLVSKLSTVEFERMSRRGTRNVEAYDLFQRGWQAILILSPESNARAIRLFEAAIKLDPNYARAYAGLSVSRASNVYFKWARGPNDTFGHAMGLAQKAVALDPNDELGHRMLGSVFRLQGQFDRAIEAYEKALSRSPSNPDVLMTLALVSAFAGHGTKAVGHARMAMRLNPHAPAHYWAWQGIAFYVNREFADAAKATKRFQRMNPRLAASYYWLAASYAQLGKMEEARAARKALLARRPRFTIQEFLKRTPLQGDARNVVIEGFRKAGFPEN